MQYCAKVYQDVHSKHKVTCSMTDGYDCYQNALAERVIGILKNEYLLQRGKELGRVHTKLGDGMHGRLAAQWRSKAGALPATATP